MGHAVIRSSSGGIAGPGPAMPCPDIDTPPPRAALDERQRRCNQLLADVARGDRDSFRSLYALTSAMLFAVVRRTVWHRGEAEDVMQEVYLKVWRHAGAFDPLQSHALTWMGRVARNHAIDHLRRQATRPVITPDSLHGEATDSADAAIDAAPRPDEWLELEQQRQRIDGLLATLSGIQRQVLTMAFREGRSQSDIAAQLGAPIGSVKSWMRRALQQLKRSIDDGEQGRHGSDA